MMKVMCIDASMTKEIPNPLTEGEIYTVDRVVDAYDDFFDAKWSIGYILKETEDWHEVYRKAFNPKRFVPISDIDETELIKQREEVFA